MHVSLLDSLATIVAKARAVGARQRRGRRLRAFPSLMLRLGAIVVALGTLIHATLCAIQHRDYLKAAQQPFVFPPPEISIQCIVAVVLGTWGVVGLQGSFMPIRTTEVLGKQTMDCLEPGPDFVHFRGRELR